MLHENSLAASVPFPYEALDQEPTQRRPESPVSEVEKCEFGRRLLSYIRSKDRARLTVDCLFLALGDAELSQETMTSIAKAHGITKAAVSKRTKEARRDLHLSVNFNNKSDDAVQKYRHNRSPLRLESPA